MISLASIYHPEIPAFLKPYLSTDAMQRLKLIDMNCGMNYTSYPLFRDIEAYSRFHHSLGCALIVWHFTQSREQTLAALFHDISTPVFSHVIDFVRYDYLKQETTENLTEAFIRRDDRIMEQLKQDGIGIGQVSDYHIYPIADNDSPKLCADRLEYILGDLIDFRFTDEDTVRRMYDDLSVCPNEEGDPELCFRSEEIAAQFLRYALKCGKIYSGDEDRYAMEKLAGIIRNALAQGILQEADLYSGEDEVIHRLENSTLSDELMRFRKENAVIHAKPDDPKGIIIHAKKRYIDPLCINGRRISDIRNDLKQEILDFLHTGYDYPVKGVINE